jgi:uncharacterized protein (TIGR02466 family)
MKRLNIMPTTLYKFKLNNNLLESTQTMCSNLPWKTRACRQNQHYYGKSYPAFGNSLHKDKEWKKITDWCQKNIDKVVKDLNYKNMEEIKICLMWANKSETMQWHHPHKHPNSILSGILYIQGTSGETWFSRENEYAMCEQYDVIIPEKARIIHKVKPEPGTLIIFPSNLYHSVTENEGPEDRITISFNSFFRGKIGVDLTELNIDF